MKSKLIYLTHFKRNCFDENILNQDNSSTVNNITPHMDEFTLSEFNGSKIRY